jgi:DNA (cytosine-5)-methyltransferase 1
MGVNAHLVAEKPPGREFPVDGHPTLSVTMAAILQGFPASWPFQGKKTAAYRQVGNAFPPPVAEAVGRQVAAALRASEKVPVAPRVLAAETSPETLAA